MSDKWKDFAEKFGVERGVLKDFSNGRKLAQQIPDAVRENAVANAFVKFDGAIREIQKVQVGTAVVAEGVGTIADTVGVIGDIKNGVVGIFSQNNRDNRTPSIAPEPTQQQQAPAIPENERIGLPQGGNSALNADAVFQKEMKNAPNLNSNRNRRNAEAEAAANLKQFTSSDITDEQRLAMAQSLEDEQLNQYNAASAAYKATGDQGYKEGLLGFIQTLVQAFFGVGTPEIGREEEPDRQNGHYDTRSPAQVFKDAAIEHVVNREDGIDGFEAERDDFYAYAAQSGKTIEEAKQAVAAYAADIELALDQNPDAYKSDIRAEKQEQGLER